MADLSGLITAYAATSYVVYGPDPPFRIRIGHKCRELDALLDQRKINTWAFITAYNPGSELVTPEQNEKTMASFRNDVISAGFQFLNGSGVPDALHGSDWQPVPSLLILDIPRDTAISLGRKYGQRAIVVGVLNELAELVMLEAEAARARDRQGGS